MEKSRDPWPAPTTKKAARIRASGEREGVEAWLLVAGKPLRLLQHASSRSASAPFFASAWRRPALPCLVALVATEHMLCRLSVKPLKLAAHTARGAARANQTTATLLNPYQALYTPAARVHPHPATNRQAPNGMGRESSLIGQFVSQERTPCTNIACGGKKKFGLARLCR